jgi:serine protease AprX
VESIEEDTVYHAVRDTAEAYTGSTQASRDFGLSGDGDGDPATFSARDHTIAILDTGIDGQHQDFAGGKIIAWNDRVNGQPDPYDDEGHGTHVASIAAGAVNPSGVGGVAPGAALVGVKVLNSKGEGTASAISQGIEWCITNRARYGIEVLNLSLGSDRTSAGTDLLSRTVNRAVDAGIVVTIAAGNSGPRQRTIGSPAAADEALAVGSVADPGAGGFYLDSYSSRGPTADGRVKPDLCAPGERILAARANSGSGYVRFSGTSMAAPFVAGVAALIRAANPALTAADVKNVLKETAVHFGADGENDDFGAGRMDAYAAVARALGKSGTPPAGPGHLSASGHLLGADDRSTWQLALSDTGFPVAVTLIQQGTGGGFTLQVYDPSGAIVARSTARSRQAMASFRPTDTGTYSLVVLSPGDAGDYSLDVSAGSELPLKEAP